MSLRSRVLTASSLTFVFWTSCSGSDELTARPAEPERSVALTWTSSALVEQDSLLKVAARAIAQQRPTLATRILAPRLQDSTRRTPAAVLLAAEAAAAWNGWSEVERLLANERWLDTVAQGRARELLGRAALDRSPRTRTVDSLALFNLERAVTLAKDDRTRAVRSVLMARALDRLDQLDRAATAYRKAGEELKSVSDWLYLRAAAVTMQEGDRVRLLAEVMSPLARSRRLWAEADARVRAGDASGAAASLLLAGDTIASLRLRLSKTPPSEVERAEIRSWLTQQLAVEPGSGTSRDAAELLLEHFAPLTSGEHLAIARSDALTGAVDRAIRSFNAAFSMSAGNAQDRFALATLLSRAGRDREAAAQFARVDSPRALAASAEYQRARSLLRSNQSAAAQRLLRDVASRYADLEDGSANALYLLGDLASDARRDAEARSHWLQLGRKYRTHSLAQTGRFRAALMAYVAGDIRTAASEWAAIVAEYPDGSEINASEYWAGRALHRLGKASEAATHWRNVVQREPRSYYAMLSAQRLGERPFAPQVTSRIGDNEWLGDSRFVERQAEAAQMQLGRAALLEELGLAPEAALERDALYRDASAAGVTVPRPVAAREPTGAPSGPPRTDTLASRALAAAYAFSRAGFASRGILLAERARALGMQLQPQDWRLLYPITHPDVIRAEASRNRVDAALVAAIIRQESRFTPTALSSAGARGLMQIMPPVGRSLARARGITPWNDMMLYQPDVSIELGTMHLAGDLRRDGNPTHALAAYNAGRSRLTRWRNLRGSDDPELFIERIPYAETRDYVRIVLRHQEFYRALYPLDTNAAASAPEAPTQLE